VTQQSGSSSYQLIRIEALSVYLNANIERSQFLFQDPQWMQHMQSALQQFKIKATPLDFGEQN